MNHDVSSGVFAGSRWTRGFLRLALPAVMLLGCGDSGDAASGGGGSAPLSTSSGGGASSTSTVSFTSTTSGSGGAPTSTVASTSASGDASTSTVASTSASSASGASSTSVASSTSSTSSGTTSTTTSTSTGTGPNDGTPVGQHGRLRVMGNRVVGEHGQPVQLKGMSLFWSVWEGAKYYNASVVNTLVDDWKVTAIRAAMTVNTQDGMAQVGYVNKPDEEERKVRAIVDAAIDRGIYVLIDWHDHDAEQHTDASKRFFRKMAEEYGDEPGVIFEVFNEPVNQSWDQVKSYAEQVIGEIRGAGSENLVIVGSPHWSQDADVASRSPITRFQNIAYTVHFYASTHKDDLRMRSMNAMNAGLALFATEWGTCDASGNGALDFGETQRWIDFMNSNKISWLNWSIVDKAESCAALKPGANANGPWSDDQLTESGKWIKAKIQAP